MECFVMHTAVVAPLDRADVDTDQIIPKQFLKRIERTGFGRFLFHDWRREPSFVLDDPRYEGAGIIVTGRNFGCGSSREHAPWALADYGFRAIVAPSFADIFANNCLKNGLLPVVLAETEVAHLMERAGSGDGYRATVDLERCEVRDEEGFVARFEIDPFWRSCLMEGLDEIGLTLVHEPAITAYEQRCSR
jgi:3-isopropylmalate/(R)-2-methylmalate dehydratase small subunit